MIGWMEWGRWWTFVMIASKLKPMSIMIPAQIASIKIRGKEKD